MPISKINTDTKLARLSIQREPYWEQLSKGRFLGYRKGAKPGGTWVARLGKKSGSIGKFRPGDDSSMDYESALQEAIKWCDREETGANRKYTVADCLQDYYKAQSIDRNPQTAAATETRLTKHLTDEDGKDLPLLTADVRKLTTVELRSWRDSMVADGDAETVRKSKDSANRTWSMLRAALNKAFDDDVVESDTAWKKVKPFKKVGKARDLFLTDQQVSDLLAHTTGAFHSLCKAAILTGARYGELAAAKVSDLKGDGILHLDGKTGERDVFLSHEAEMFFKKQAKDKLPEAPLLMSHDGYHWKHGQQQPPMKNAVRAAKLPADTVFYSLRHYHISKAVLSGMSLLLIAQNCGTSVQMIQDHYGKFQPDNKRALMDLVELAGVK